MDQIVNYHKLMKEELKSFDGKKKKLLLHVCCGPCFTVPFKRIKDYFDITIIYNNSNIYPKEEYERRLMELKWYLGLIGEAKNVKIIVPEYDNETFTKDLEPYKDQPEGHERCRICFRKRLSYAFEYAAKNGFEYVGTVMSISRYKNAQDINRIGKDLETKFPNIKWLYADFKKENGYEEELDICRGCGMYFQKYCGCKFSYEKMLEKNQKIEQKND